MLVFTGVKRAFSIFYESLKLCIYNKHYLQVYSTMKRNRSSQQQNVNKAVNITILITIFTCLTLYKK